MASHRKKKRTPEEMQEVEPPKEVLQKVEKLKLDHQIEARARRNYEKRLQEEYNNKFKKGETLLRYFSCPSGLSGSYECPRATVVIGNVHRWFSLFQCKPLTIPPTMNYSSLQLLIGIPTC